MKYARVLIEHCSMDATRLFVDYYTSKYKPRVDPPVAANDAPVTNNGGGFVTGAANAVQNLSNLLPLPYMNPLAVASNSQAAAKPTVSDAEVVKPEEPATPKYTPPRPRTAFSSFIDHPDEFIIFLEALLKEGTNSLSEADKIDIHTTLFEMYLHKANEKPGDDQHREEWESKAKSLIISSPSKDTATTAPPPTTPGGALPKIENSNVLLLSHLASFRTGTVLMQEQSNLLFDIFRSYTSARDTKGAIRALRKYGPSEPQLYPLALSYLTSSPTILSEAGEAELSAILEKIDRDGLMAPLQVVQTLSKHGVATMGMLKPYLQGRIERERKEIRENRRDVEAFRKETEQRRQELEELETKPQVFQATRCGVCGGGLERELPVVHFLCRHSFHGRCLRGVAGVNVEHVRGGGGREAEASAEGGECPLCAKDNATIRALKKSQEENAERHELFRDDLERSEDRFKTVAQWFGRGVMSVPNVE